MEATVIGFQLLIWAVILVLIIYLAFRQNRIKKNEKFEQRDN